MPSQDTPIIREIYSIMLFSWFNNAVILGCPNLGMDLVINERFGKKTLKHTFNLIDNENART